MKNKLAVKLFSAFLMITVLSLSITGISVNRFLDHYFSNYLENVQKSQYQDIKDFMETYYESTNSWRGITNNLTHIALSSEIKIQVSDKEGSIIYDSEKDMMVQRMGRMAQGRMGMHRDGSKINLEEVEENFIYPLTAKEQHIGELQIKAPSKDFLWTEEDLTFIGTVRNIIIYIGIGASVFALFLSYFFSIKLTHPLKEMTLAVKKMEKGDYSPRVTIFSEDELGILSSSFNEMAQKLEDTSKLRKKLTADISHELRTPLTTIRSYLEGFEQAVIPVNKENITSTIEEIDRLTTLVNDLRELSLVECDIKKMDREKLDLANIVYKAVEKNKPLYKKKNIDLSLRLLIKPAFIYGDKESLEKILYNLLTNAYNYSENKGKVLVELSRLKPNQLLVKIKDNGIGIDPEDLPYIFERFYRTDLSRTRSTGGTGIGLTIVKELIDALQGDIRVESTLNKGTTFYMTFEEL